MKLKLVLDIRTFCGKWLDLTIDDLNDKDKMNKLTDEIIEINDSRFDVVCADLDVLIAKLAENLK